MSSFVSPRSVSTILFMSTILITLLFTAPGVHAGETVEEDWVVVYDAVGLRDTAMSVIVDGYNNVIMAGSSQGSTSNGTDYPTGYDFVVIKYTSDGTPVWTSRYNSEEGFDDYSMAMVLDEDGNAYVTGHSDGFGTDNDILTIKFRNSDGQQLWNTRYDGLSNLADCPYSMDKDSAGNLYVVGYSTSSVTGIDVITIKYDSDGNEVWATTYNRGSWNGIDYGDDLVVDEDGNVYTLAWTVNQFDNRDITIIKYNSLGEELWDEQYDGPDEDDESTGSIALDNDGDLIVTGSATTNSTTHSRDAVVLKYDSTGSRLWTYLYDSPVKETDYDFAWNILFDDSGNMYISGLADNGSTFQSWDYLAMYFPYGTSNPSWISTYGGTGEDCDNVRGMALDDFGNLYLTGRTRSAAGTNDSTTVKYGPDGEEIWAVSYTVPSVDITSYGMSVITAGSFYITGTYLSSVDDGDIFTLKYVINCDDCLIDSVCYDDGDTNPDNPCQICDTDVSETVWANNDGGSCDDGLYCTTDDICTGGACVGEARDCDDGVDCTDDSCYETGATCLHTANDDNCDDGAWCNGTETCDASLDCQAGTPPDCNDSVTCTDDSCDEAGDACLNDPNNAYCTDGLWCNGTEYCNESLGCRNGTAPDCNDGVSCTDDSCDEAGDACTNNPNDAHCDNGQWCDGAETCDATLGCQNGAVPDCDDSVSCTDDSCDEAGDTCVNDPNDAHCDNGLWCDGAETCDATLDCQDGTESCPDDNLFCNGVESCSEVGDECLHTGDPCAANETCNEETDACDPVGDDDDDDDTGGDDDNDTGGDDDDDTGGDDDDDDTSGDDDDNDTGGDDDDDDNDDDDNDDDDSCGS